MQPNTVLKGADDLNAETANDHPEADDVTLRTVCAAIVAKLRAIFSARHAPDRASDEAAAEEVLGEQVVLPTAFVKEVSAFTPKDGRG